MKKITSILLITAFAANSIIYFIVFPFVIDFLKDRFSEENEENDCQINTVITITDGKPCEYTFINEKELKCGVELYDIIKIEKLPGATKYYCYHDKEEEGLQKDFWQEPSSIGIPEIKHVTNIIPLTIYVVAENQSITRSEMNLGIYPIPVLNKISNFISDVLTPPPENLS